MPPRSYEELACWPFTGCPCGLPSCAFDRLVGDALLRSGVALAHEVRVGRRQSRTEDHRLHAEHTPALWPHHRFVAGGNPGQATANATVKLLDEIRSEYEPALEAS